MNKKQREVKASKTPSAGESNSPKAGIKSKIKKKVAKRKKTAKIKK